MEKSRFFDKPKQEFLKKVKDKKGIAGLEVLTSVIVAIFLIGFIVMIFSLMGSRIQDQLGTTTGDNISRTVINDTITAIDDVTDWFGIIIIIAAMVVLILLTVIIIRSIRGSGISGA